MAITNPSASDFQNNQERGLDYQEYRSSANILRALADFYKITYLTTELDGTKLNLLSTGFDATADVDDDYIYIHISPGSGVLDNQPIEITEEMVYQYDKPTSDTTYYVYLYYKYVDEYPANYAFYKVVTSELTNTDNYMIIAKVTYNSDDDSVAADNTVKGELLAASASVIDGGEF